MGKSLFGSKTAWFNFAMSVVLAVGTNFDVPFITQIASNPEIMGYIITGGNMLLRLITGKPIESVMPKAVPSVLIPIGLTFGLGFGLSGCGIGAELGFLDDSYKGSFIRGDLYADACDLIDGEWSWKPGSSPACAKELF